MSHHHSHLKSALQIIQTHKAGEPLVHHLKRFFAADKKYGSKDRKQISSLCYNYYRLGNALKNSTVEEKIIVSTYLCNSKSNGFLEKMNPALNEKIHFNLEEKITFLEIKFADIFPFQNELTEEIEKNKFTVSFLKQPLFFLRIRPGKEEMVLQKLAGNKVDFEEISTSCIALQQGFKTESLFIPNEHVIVQDRSSQQVFNYLQNQNVFLKKNISVWDCCAASGGKSILLYDMLHGQLQLHVSDVRANILNNLRNRFKVAGIKNYQSFTANLSQNYSVKNNQKFDVIICDVPCTGSGTWARTPEQSVFFEKEKIKEYAAIQLKIASAAINQLNRDGLFFYITCSVFKKENEAVVEILKQKFHLQLLQMEYIKGYEVQADTMFVAVFTV